MEEGMHNLNRKVLTYYAANHQRTAIFQRVKSISSNGFYLYGRRYSFLAFSAKPIEGYSRYVADMRKKDMNICSPFGSNSCSNIGNELLEAVSQYCPNLNVAVLKNCPLKELRVSFLQLVIDKSNSVSISGCNGDSGLGLQVI
ncbi:hypothetical protein KY284_022976 [Solanum tuberosum]|nr:hypothetical protein KY284_022976 [Solanum tuberosum]